ncbi:hypothetical protein C5615_38700, partial [Burkholderia cepacia]
PIGQAGYMHADHFDITNKKLAKGVGSIHARKGRLPHHSLLETVPQSIFARAPNFDAALRAISRYRCPPLRLSKTLR